MKYKKENVLIIADLHLPYEHKRYLDFVVEIRDRCKCGTVVQIGDLVDHHAISFHTPDPEAPGPADEMKKVDKKLPAWFKAFPKVKICKGNHDIRPSRKGKTVGLPMRLFKPFNERWNMPKGWEYDYEYVINNVLYKHGTGSGSKFSHVLAAERARMSTVIGHTHSVCGVEYLASSRDCIFGMNVGSGIDRKSFAFAYGNDFPRKPIISCGIVTDNGTFAQVFPLKL